MCGFLECRNLHFLAIIKVGLLVCDVKLLSFIRRSFVVDALVMGS